MLLGDEAFLPQARDPGKAHAPAGAVDQLHHDLAAAIRWRRQIEPRIGLRDAFEMAWKLIAHDSRYSPSVVRPACCR